MRRYIIKLRVSLTPYVFQETTNSWEFKKHQKVKFTKDLDSIQGTAASHLSRSVRTQLLKQKFNIMHIDLILELPREQVRT